VRNQEVAKRVAARLEALVKDRGLSQRAFAKRAGLSPAVVSRALRGLYTPSIATLEQLCAGLGVTLGQFFSDEGGPLPVLREPAHPEHAAKLQQVLARLPPKSQGRFVAGIEAVVRSVEGRGQGR